CGIPSTRTLRLTLIISSFRAFGNRSRTAAAAGPHPDRPRDMKHEFKPVCAGCRKNTCEEQLDIPLNDRNDKIEKQQRDADRVLKNKPVDTFDATRHSFMTAF
ncbi:MAG: hypothetical protein Q4D81_13920, partial [Eubacteriales bacterium]|nr:hypothetical protein [Eubacteriales bacterium]